MSVLFPKRLKSLLDFFYLSIFLTVLYEECNVYVLVLMAQLNKKRGIEMIEIENFF